MTFKRTTLEETLAVSPLLVLDGAMSTPLENMGIDLNTKLWTAKVLADQPEMVKQVHKNYFKAGADCGITCSYQATVPGLMDIGYTKEQAEELIAKSVEIFLKAREEWWQEEGEKAGHTWPGIMKCPKRLFMNFISTEWSFCGKQGQICFCLKHSLL